MAIPTLWTLIIGFLATSLVPLAWLLLRGLGVGFITYTGIDFLIDTLAEKVAESFGALPLQVYQMVSLIGIPEALNIILSSFTAIAVIKGIMALDGRPRRKAVWGTPGGAPIPPGGA